MLSREAEVEPEAPSALGGHSAQGRMGTPALDEPQDSCPWVVDPAQLLLVHLPPPQSPIH